MMRMLFGLNINKKTKQLQPERISVRESGHYHIVIEGLDRGQSEYLMRSTAISSIKRWTIVPAERRLIVEFTHMGYVNGVSSMSLQRFHMDNMTNYFKQWAELENRRRGV